MLRSEDIEGKPLEVLGGEGLLLEQPLTRESFEKNLRSSALLFYSASTLPFKTRK